MKSYTGYTTQLEYKNKNITRNKSNDYFESTQCNTGRTCLSLPIITRENTSLAIHVVQKITIISPQKIGKFAV